VTTTIEEDEPDFALGPVAVPKASDVLADHLREQILSGKLEEGSALPVERELAAAVGLSRGVVRDALRVLEIEGLITTRPGRAGGSFVRRPDATTLQRSLSVLVSGRGVRFQSLLETRDALEPAAAELAALNRTPQDLARLDEASQLLRDSVGDIPKFLQHNAEWHVAVAAASHNEIMQIILDSLSRAIVKATDISDFNSQRTMNETLAAHDRILAAIRKGDPHKAAAAMEKHVHGYRLLIETYEHPEELRV
jgi:GntR family transcriptional regulator, transcriptional repressor for pyruvate dehydrogenase complex